VTDRLPHRSGSECTGALCLTISPVEKQCTVTTCCSGRDGLLSLPVVAALAGPPTTKNQKSFTHSSTPQEIVF